MTKGQAMAQVASHVATLLAASDFEQATGVNQDDVGEADARKLQVAVEDLRDRLYRMGSTK